MSAAARTGDAASPSIPARKTFFSSRPVRDRIVDSAALSSLVIIALLGFRTTYGGVQFVVTGLAALAFGLLIALAAARWSWGPLRIALAVVLVHLVLGTPFAAPARGLLGVIPTLGSLGELLTAPVRAWKITLTMAPPVGTAQGVLVVEWLSVLLLSLLAFTVALRTRAYVAAWLFPVALVGVTVVFGTIEATWPLTRGILFGLVSVAWLSWRFESARLASARSTIISDTVRPGSWSNPVLRRRVLGGALVLALAAGIAVAARPLLDPPEHTARFALRDTIRPPFDPFDYTSPLAQFRGYVKDEADTTLLTVDGARPGERVTLAAMDEYDREVYLVAGGDDKDSPSGAFLRTAADVDLDGEVPGTRTATFTMGTYDRVWMPSLGTRTTRVSPRGEGSARIAENLYRNASSGTLVDRAGLHEGDAYSVTYVPYSDPTPAQRDRLRFGEIDLPPLPPLDPKVRARAQEWMGDARTDYGRMQNLTAHIKSTAAFTHGLEGETTSAPGHSEFRLLSMLEDVGFDEDDPAASPTGLIGDQEQLATLTAVLARSAGIPARVVMGFTVPDGEGPVSVTGDDVTAWVEVYFQGRGWVRFDPTPEDDKNLTQPEEVEVDQPKPQVAQPPPPPVEPPRLPPAMTGDAGDRPDPVEPPLSTWTLIGLAVAVPLLVVAVVLGAIVGVKALRRRRRRLRGMAHERIGGGWSEILDRSTDLGHAPPRRATRQEIAADLGAAFPTADLPLLARRADQGVFGPEDMAPEAVEEYWDRVAASRRAMGGDRSRFRRFLAAISLRSLRPGRYTRRARGASWAARFRGRRRS